MVFFKHVCCSPLKATTRAFAGQPRKNASMFSRQTSSPTYNKKLLGTSPALLQEVALPANFMLRNVSTLAPGFEAGVRLLQGGRRPSTVKSYDQKWLKFETFTAQV